MHIYFAGIGGVGLGPLAQIASRAGYAVSGSDTNESLTTRELEREGVDVFVYSQDGSRMQDIHARTPIDWFVYTSALPADHPELLLARSLGIRTSKRDELLSHIITEKQLSLIAVSGTHGKTTTTGMLVWAMDRLGIPVSYSVGSTLSFGPAGNYDEAARYFVYECDEFDRNFLSFRPAVALITTVDHDHFDTYPTEQEYVEAFRTFAAASGHVITWEPLRTVFHGLPNVSFLGEPHPLLTLPGEHNRRNATLVLRVLRGLGYKEPNIIDALNDFPGTSRRFERLAANLYSDYGHHPVEIRATLQLARELNPRVTLVYQPHQNVRQREIKDDYLPAVFEGADTIYWLPTYLTREPQGDAIIEPADLTARLDQSKIIHASLDDELWDAVLADLAQGRLVLFMGAGTIDAWVRSRAALFN